MSTENNDDSDNEPFNEMSSNATGPGRKSITAVLDDDEDAEILGFLMMSTTGDWLYPPREELKEKFEQYNIPMKLMPRKVAPWMAYSRMGNELIYSENEDVVTSVTGFELPLDVNFRIEEGSGKYKHVYADVFYPEEVVGEKGGDHNSVKLLTINFLGEIENPKITTDPQIDEDHALWDHCTSFMARAQTLFNKHQECHNGSDLRSNIINQFIYDEANTVRFRNGCYFVGAHHQDTVEGLSEIWSWLNNFKERGQRCKIDTVPVVDSEKQREQVERLAREKTETMVNEAIEEALEDLTSDDSTEEIAQAIVDDASEATGFTEEYNALLDARLSVEEVLEDKRGELEGKKEEIVSSALEQMD